MKTCLLCSRLGYNNKTKSGKLSLFELPSNPSQRQLWMDVFKEINLNRIPIKNPKVCEKHFQVGDFSFSTPNRKRLQPWAVPSVSIRSKIKTKNADDHTSSLGDVRSAEAHFAPESKLNIPLLSVSVSTQVNMINWEEQESIRVENKLIQQGIKRLEARNLKLDKHLEFMKKKFEKSEVIASTIKKIIADASENNTQAVLLLDRIINYGKWNKVSWKLTSKQDA